ncbi:bifunctional alpha,alpha-trehalose-phosphate synthase (UDP-forming)/trehalose-phosphatase [Phycisphaera mikurensis]|uniref:bifunctional alpha,alpha-trehalose-phosphate synthase (UDP-forming)/trehalose-phosphatase n=1 Tax=Phycisphaera mikurensis TaxID=547188 RepID=UPI0021BC16B9|nr:bifunctional alpha,alpha-trehalose-phosphate synthase (UDP-forming)/trehalose-phosphatase [Phycisphaera mikurensis]
MCVSNRLPFSLAADGAACRSVGGLASALGGVGELFGLVWIGWSGAAPSHRTDAVDAAERQAVANAAQTLGCDCRSVPMNQGEADGFYRGLANASLWPLLHDDLAHFRYRPDWWDAYAAVNERFAEAVAGAASPGERVWIHDYHLMLLPGLLRRRRPDLRIGFFLHTPFPSADAFRRHPRREELLAGVLGAGLIGFQTRRHLEHFEEAAQRIGGHACGAGGIRHRRGRTRTGVFPIGIDASRFERGLADPATAAYAERLAAARGGRRLVLSVERLDPTKGIPQKLDAIEAFLELHPGQKEEVEFLLIAVPSREDAPAYRRLREEVEGRVGRINGKHGAPDRVPVRLICRGVGFHELCALYRSADACLVTPLADGMNLVAKEYLACQPEGGGGVLVLSEFAGAADELRGALRVNPHDTLAVAGAIAEALTRPEDARRAALAPMREHVRTHHAGGWATRFLAALDAAAACSRPQPRPTRTLREADLAAFAASAAGRKALFLDYDGTLRGFVDDPERATPQPPLRRVLRALSERDDLDVFIVSGRKLDFLRRHLGGYGFTLVGEHGHAWCKPGEEPEALDDAAGPAWRPVVTATMKRFAEATPGSHVEEKAAGVVWHHRRADRELGRRRALELAEQLVADTAGSAARVTQGKRIVEVTDQRADKGDAVDRFLGEASAAGTPYAAVLCIGDDRTDEAMFRGRRGDPAAVTVRVGPGETAAAFRVAGTDRVLALLCAIAAEPDRALAGV